MSKTFKHIRAQKERQTRTNIWNPIQVDFDGRRYGNKRRAIARLKVKDRRRQKRNDKHNLKSFEGPLVKKHDIE